MSRSHDYRDAIKVRKEGESLMSEARSNLAEAFKNLEEARKHIEEAKAHNRNSIILLSIASVAVAASIGLQVYSYFCT